jgi:hypothetical protein
VNALGNVLQWPAADLPLNNGIDIIFGLADFVDVHEVEAAIDNVDITNRLRLGDPSVQSADSRVVNDVPVRDWRGQEIGRIARALLVSVRYPHEVLPCERNRRMAILAHSLLAQRT